MTEHQIQVNYAPAPPGGNLWASSENFNVASWGLIFCSLACRTEDSGSLGYGCTAQRSTTFHARHVRPTVHLMFGHVGADFSIPIYIGVNRRTPGTDGVLQNLAQMFRQPGNLDGTQFV